VKAVLEKAQGIHSGRGGSNSKVNGAKGKPNAAQGTQKPSRNETYGSAMWPNVAVKTTKARGQIEAAPATAAAARGEYRRMQWAPPRTQINNDLPTERISAAERVNPPHMGDISVARRPITDAERPSGSMQTTPQPDHREARQKEHNLRGRWSGDSNRHPASLTDHPRHMSSRSKANHKITGAERQSGSMQTTPQPDPPRGEAKGSKQKGAGGKRLKQTPGGSYGRHKRG